MTKYIDDQYEYHCEDCKKFQFTQPVCHTPGGPRRVTAMSVACEWFELSTADDRDEQDNILDKYERGQCCSNNDDCCGGSKGGCGGSCGGGCKH